MNAASDNRRWPPPRVPILYRVSRLFVGLGMAGYFRGIEVTGAHNIPSRGPVIFASNHPHSITDALVLGRGTGRMLHFLAHSGLFASPVKAWFLRHSGVIPIYRAQDVASAAEDNQAMFAACHEVLRAGGAIGIFPEGTSAEERRVQKLKTGTARIALGAEAAKDWHLGVQVIPVGLNFESANRFRSRVLIRFGLPLAVAQYQTQYAANPMAAVTDLTKKLQHRLRQQVVNVAETESEQLVRDVEAIYRSELLGRAELTIPGRTEFQKGQTISREFARALDYFREYKPEILWGLAQRLRRYNAVCRALKLKDSMLRAEQGPTVRRELSRFTYMGLAGLPWGLLGLLGNYLPYKLTGLLTRRLAADRTKIHITQLGLGCLLFVPWYAALWRIFWPAYGTLPASLLILSLPPSGLFARRYFRYLGRRRQMIRFAWLELVHGLRIADLRRQRRRLIRDLDAAMAAYLTSLEEHR